MAFGPVGIHPVEHLGPVLRLGAARSRMEGEYGVAGIVFAGQQGGEALFIQRLLYLSHPGRAFLQHGEIPLLVGQADQGEVS